MEVHGVCGKGYYYSGYMEVAEVGERATTVLHVVDQKGNACTVPVEAIFTELVLNSTKEKMGINQYEISYEATTGGRHIEVEGEHIKGSPFCITAIKKLGTPIKIITGARGLAVNQRGEIIVGEAGSDCVSIFSSRGEIHFIHLAHKVLHKGKLTEFKEWQ